MRISRKRDVRFILFQKIPFCTQAWADASETIRKIQYPMLGDPAGVLARQFGVLEEEAGQALRATFILNPEGKIRAYEIHDMGIGQEMPRKLLRKVQAAKYVEEHGIRCRPNGSRERKP